MGPRRISSASRTVLLASLVALAGCGGSTATAAPTVVPTAVITPAPTAVSTPTAAPAATGAPIALQTGRVEVTEHGFAITLADGWSSIPLKPEDVTELLKGVDPESPLGQLLESQAGQGATQGVKFWAFDVRESSMSSGFAANLNVLVAPTTGMSIATVASLSTAQIKPYLDEGTKIDIKEVTIPAGPAATVAYSITFPTAGGAEVKVHGKQLYIATDTNTLVFTWSCGAATPGTCPADTEAMIQSVELL